MTPAQRRHLALQALCLTPAPATHYATRVVRVGGPERLVMAYPPLVMGCSEAWAFGPCVTRRQCLRCGRWECVEAAGYLLCGECRRGP